MTVHTPGNDFPLSAQQEFHWETLRFRSLGRRLAGRGGPFIVLRSKGPIDVARLRTVLAEMLERHESLRTSLTDLGTQPLQRVSPDLAPPLSYVDLKDNPERYRTELAHNLIEAERNREFDPLHAPMWHCLVVAISDDEHLLALNFCHLVIDGVSLMSFLDQVSRLYCGQEVPRPLLQYRHFVEQSRRSVGDIENRLAYWRREMLPLPPRITCPTDYGAAPPAFLSTGTLRFRSKVLEENVRRTCRAASVTPFMLYLAAYAFVLSRVSQRNRVIFGSSLARLDLRPDEKMLGYFLDLMLIPVRIPRRGTLLELLVEVRRVVVGGQENALPYTTVAAALYPDFAQDRPWPGLNLYDAWVRGRVFESTSDDAIAFGAAKLSLHSPTKGSGDLHFTDARQVRTYSRNYLPALYLDDVTGSSGYFEYNRAVFSAASVGRMAARVDAVIALLATPDVPLELAWGKVLQEESELEGSARHPLPYDERVAINGGK
jgi:hypothetical protein